MRRRWIPAHCRPVKTSTMLTCDQPTAINGRTCPIRQGLPSEVELTVEPLARGRSDLTAWGTEGAVARTFYGLVYAQSAAGYDRIRVCTSRDGSQAIADLAVADWERLVAAAIHNRYPHAYRVCAI